MSYDYYAVQYTVLLIALYRHFDDHYKAHKCTPVNLNQLTSSLDTIVDKKTSNEKFRIIKINYK